MSDDLTFEEMMDFAVSRVEDEDAQFDGDLPNHAARLLSLDASELLEFVMEHEIAQAHEGVPTEEHGERVTEAVEEQVVQILMTIGALKYEYDLDIESAFKEHMEFVEDYEKFEDDIEDMDGQAEIAEAFDEHMSEHADENPIRQGGVSPGDNVDSDDYDADDDRDRHIA